MRRQVRVWVVAGLSVVVGLVAFYYLARHHAAYSSVVAAYGSAGPRYLVHGFAIPSFWIVLLGVVLLAFDARHRDVRERIADSVDCRPMSSLALLAGRCLGVVAISWAQIIALAAFVQVFGSLARRHGWRVGEPVEAASLVAFVVVDCLPALLVSCSFVMLLAAALRNRLLVVLLATAALALPYWALFNVPIYLLPTVSLVANFGIPASDILPTSFDGWIVTQRALLLLIAAGLLAASAALYPRADVGSWAGFRAGIVGGMLVLVGVVGIVLLAARAVHAMTLRDEWESVHRAYGDSPQADIEHIDGHVRIDPGNRLTLDIDLSLSRPTDMSEELVFSFNPGMRVIRLLIDGKPADHRHEFGVLTVHAPHAPVSDTGFRLTMRAEGMPDPHYGYLDSAIVATAETWTDSRLTSWGTDASIFENGYVALMPASRWLPMAGPNLDDAPLRHPRDFFTIDLEVETPVDWLVAGPGRREHVDDGRPWFRFRPVAPLPEVALIAARFERYATKIDDVDLELLIDPKHVRNVAWFSSAKDDLIARLQWFFGQTRTLGLGYPYGGLSVVEVPARLRTYGGGWRMTATRSLPGMLLLREHGFPAARFDSRSGQTEPPGSRKLSMLSSYFDEQGGNELLADASRNLFGFLTGPQGESAVAVEFVLDDLVAQLLYQRGGWPSAHALVSDAGAISSPTLPQWMTHGAGNVLGIVHPAAWETSRLSARNRDFGSALANLPFDEEPEEALRLLSAKGYVVARALIDVLGREDAAVLLAELRETRLGGTFSVDDLEVSLENRGTPLAPVLSNWLRGATLPGFLASPVEMVRLGDDATGQPRYQVRVHIHNAEAAPGLVQIEYGTAAANNSDFLVRHFADPVHVPANSSVEIGLTSSERPLDLWLLSYLSLNGQDLRLPLPDIGAEEVALGEPFVGSRASDWRPEDPSGIVVDDLDVGFSVVAAVETGLVDRLAGAIDRRSDAIEKDHGLPPYRMTFAGTLARRETAASRWFRQEFASAWGKYRRTIARASAGDGTHHAVFATVLPAEGLWRLDYHLPDLTQRPRFSSVFRTRMPVGTWNGGPLRTYQMTLLVNGEETVIEFDAAGVGWHTIGTFELFPGEARVMVSNQTSGAAVIADAIRWTRLDNCPRL